jgi:arsenate reductase
MSNLESGAGELNPNILVLCTGNSCRSQMAEGYLRYFAGHRFNVHSAGTDPKDEVHPLAVQVMLDAGIDISEQRPKGLQEFLGRMPIRYLIIVCSGADESCPRIFPGLSERLFWPFDDPAHFEGTPEETVAEFRRVRDEIRERVIEWLKAFPDHE